MRHEHPIKILRYSAKNLWLLSFPLLRGLQLYPLHLVNPVEWLRGAWFDLLVAAMILGFGGLRWFFCSFAFQENCIRFQSGILMRHETEIPCANITVATEEHAFYLRPLRAVRVRIYTAAGQFPETDVQILMRKHDLLEMKHLIPLMRPISARPQQYRTNWLFLFLFSVLFSSSFSGAAYAAAVMIQGGRITRDLLTELQLEELFWDVTDQAAYYLNGIPLVIVALGVLIFASWCISFFANLLNYGNFSLHPGKQHVSIRAGLLTKRLHHIRSGTVNYTDIRQNLIMKLFHMMSVHINCPGYGSNRTVLPVLLPLLSRSQFQNVPKTLIPYQIPQKQDPKTVSFRAPRIKSLWLYIWQPTLLLAGVCLLTLGLRILFPLFDRIIVPIGLMLLIPCAWLLIIRLISLFTTKIRWDDTAIYMQYSNGMTFHTILAKWEQLVQIELRQTPGQRRMGVCHITVFFNSRTPTRHTLRAMPLAAAQALLTQAQHRKH